MLKSTMTILKDLLDENQYQDANLRQQIKEINDKVVILKDDGDDVLNAAIDSIHLE